MKIWRKLIKKTITTPEALAKVLDVNIEEIKKVHKKFPLRVDPYYLGLIQEKDDPIWKMVVPDIKELEGGGVKDSLSEEEQSPVPSIIHRYPDRVLFYTSYLCSANCRFCTRRHRVGDPRSIHAKGMEMGLEYIREHKEIRDVLLSGGDPLMMSDKRIEFLLNNISKIKHVEIIRIGSRVPVTLPHRITKKLCSILAKYSPIYFMTHFNHPREITREAKAACRRLSKTGTPLFNQTVLMKGINDDPEIMKELMHKLLQINVKPYYLYQMDLVKGTEHFRTSVQIGFDIIKKLRGHTSGLAIPHYIIDCPGGGGKVALDPPDNIHSFDEKKIKIKNYKGEIYSYPNS